MAGLREIVAAFDVSKVSESYSGPLEITDLKDMLGTRGHVLVVCGDKAYAEELGERAELANPKFWLYEHLLHSTRVQAELAQNPEAALLDATGFSALEAVGYHARQLGRKAVVVMAHEFLPPADIFKRYDIEVIHADLPAEEGYVRKLEEVVRSRKNLIFLNQGLYGPQALAPIGNRIVEDLEEKMLIPNETYWVLGTGANIYGIGSKIAAAFRSKTIIVEPSDAPTLPPDLSSPTAVKAFSRHAWRTYQIKNWGGVYSGMFPLHLQFPSRYPLLLWAHTGNVGFDEARNVHAFEATQLQRALRRLSPDYDWTETTALALVPAIESARKGKNVLVMAYGKWRKHRTRGGSVVNAPPWIFRGETTLQKAALAATVIAYAALGFFYVRDVPPDAPSWPVP